MVYKWLRTNNSNVIICWWCFFSHRLPRIWDNQIIYSLHEINSSDYKKNSSHNKYISQWSILYWVLFCFFIQILGSQKNVFNKCLEASIWGKTDGLNFLQDRVTSQTLTKSHHQITHETIFRKRGYFPLTHIIPSRTLLGISSGINSSASNTVSQSVGLRTPACEK